jgi:hypothetical protein
MKYYTTARIVVWVVEGKIAQRKHKKFLENRNKFFEENKQKLQIHNFPKQVLCPEELEPETSEEEWLEREIAFSEL